MASLDNCIHKLEQQLRKYKEKVLDRHRTPGRQAETARARDRHRVARQLPRTLSPTRLCAAEGLEQKEGGMKFTDFVSREAIVASLAADDKEGVIREMAGALQRAAALWKGSWRASSRRSSSARSWAAQASAAAWPCRTPSTPACGRLVGTVGVSREGVDFNSLDGEKVQLVFLLVSPPDRPGDHLRALENISRQLRNDSFCRFLKQAASPEDVVQLLDEADNNQFGS